MADTPFFWGSNGQKLSPAQVESLRAVAEARGTRPVAQNLGEGLGALGDALVVNAYQGRANKAETEGQQTVLDAIAAKDWQGALANEWASPGQRAVGSAMMDRGWQLEDRSANWAREDARAAAAASQPKWKTIESGGDILRYNENDPNSKPELFFDGPNAPGYRPLTAEEKVAAGLPPDTAAQVGPDGKIDTIGGGGQTINVNTAGGADEDFYKAGAKARGEEFANLETGGRNAQTRMGQINRLETLLTNSPQGFQGAAQQFLGEAGIPTEGLDDIQAAQALINKMVPAQRPAGSGTMSDADLALFKQSLPRIINQPGGNELIVQTLKGVAVYEQEMGDIATKVLNREITPAEGQAQMKAVANPLELFRSMDESSASDAGAPPDGIDAVTWGDMTAEERALWD